MPGDPGGVDGEDIGDQQQGLLACAAGALFIGLRVNGPSTDEQSTRWVEPLAFDQDSNVKFY